jgi:hypothetical protein
VVFFFDGMMKIEHFIVQWMSGSRPMSAEKDQKQSEQLFKVKPVFHEEGMSSMKIDNSLLLGQKGRSRKR